MASEPLEGSSALHYVQGTGQATASPQPEGETMNVTIWMKSESATFAGDRAVVSSVPQVIAEKIVANFNEEFQDMGLDVTVFID